MGLCEKFYRLYDLDRFRGPVPKVTYEGSESSKVPQEAAPTVDAGKPVGKDLQPPHPFPWGWISS